MKPILPILFFVLFYSSACSSREVVIEQENIPEEVFYLADEIDPYTGKAIVYFHGTKNIQEVLNFKKGILDGEGISYYLDGSFKRKGFYLDGKMHGIWTGWDEAGNKLWEVNYENDSLNGSYTAWYPNGQIKETGEYQLNKRKGAWKSYNISGQENLQN